VSKKHEPIALRGTFGHVPTDEERAALYEPYAIAIGRLVFSWNHLHESLAQLFCALAPVHCENTMLGAWHATDSDSMQRRMLSGAVKGSLPAVLSDAQKSSVEWLLAETTKLSDARNNAVHAPLVFITSPDVGTRIAPFSQHGNPRAKRLEQAKKDLMHEIVSCRETADVLRSFALKAMVHLRRSENAERPPWPDKPALPDRDRRKNLGDRHHRIPP
jgi:hypothetical protein